LRLWGGVWVSGRAGRGVVGVRGGLTPTTVPGYETAMTGLNSRFSRYGGVAVPRQTLAVMVVSGAIAGATGTYLVTGEIMRFLDGDLVASGFAWTGLMVTLLARHRPAAILLAGFFFAVLQSGGLAMQRTTEVPWQLAQVVQAVVIVALVSRFAFDVGGRRRQVEAAEEDLTTPDDDSVPVGEV
jgi:general nucleoside transport system permease protein